MSADAPRAGGGSALKRRVSELLLPAQEGDRASAAVDAFIMTLIAVNIVALIIETVEPIRAAYGIWFRRIEQASVLLFTVEYLLRLWSATVRYPGSIRGRVRWALTPMALIDLFAVAPFWFPAGLLDLRFLRAVRLFRVIWVLKLGRYSTAMQLLATVVRAKKAELIATLSIGALILLISSSAIYFAENAVQPEVFSSIPAAMWWSMATLTTVGYGDTYPLTALGRLLGSVVAVMGIGMFALPTGILGAGFVEELERRKSRHARLCDKCRGPLEADAVPTSNSRDDLHPS